MGRRRIKLVQFELHFEVVVWIPTRGGGGGFTFTDSYGIELGGRGNTWSLPVHLAPVEQVDQDRFLTAISHWITVVWFIF